MVTKSKTDEGKRERKVRKKKKPTVGIIKEKGDGEIK